MLNFGITLLVAFAFGFLFFKLKVPGGMMVGAIIGSCVLSITTASAYMPAEAKITAQCLAGAFIACSVEKGDLKSMKKIWGPALFLLGAVLVLNIVTGLLIYWLSPLDLMTSLICAVPGGMSDIPIIAADMGADAPKVAVLQFVRMSAGIGIFPSLIALLTGDEEAKTEKTDRSGQEEQSESTAQPEKAEKMKKAETTGKREGSPLKRCGSSSTWDLLLTILVALVCGVFGRWIGIPAGALVCSMVGVIALKFASGKAFLPIWIKRLAQMLSGAYIGSGIGREDLLELRFILLPAVLLLVFYFANAVICGRLMHRFFGLGRREAMLAATPAGATDMALISSDLGVNSSTLVELQIIRMVVVVSLFPQIIKIIVTTFG